MNVLVTGAAGQLGLSMTRRLAGTHSVAALTRRDLDITDARAVLAAVEAGRPDVIVNCASYNDVNRAEVEPIVALASNAWAVKYVARAAAAIGATLVHFSTDFVFDGETDAPYTESSEPNPKSTYAMSKLLGEWLALEAPGAYVLRVESLFGGPRAKSSVDMMLDAILTGGEARPFSDRIVSPSYVEDVVAATERLLQIRPAPGLYHCVNSGWATWVDVTREMAALAGRPDARISPVKLSDVNLRPPRPRFAAMSNAKLAAAGIPMPAWQDAVRRYVALRLAR